MRGVRRVAAAAFVAIGLAVATLGAVGCGVEEGRDRAVSAAALQGRRFVATDAEGFELVDEVTLAFDDEGNVVADAGCNTMRGAYTIDDGTMEVEGLAQTLKACEADHLDQDDWLAALLESGPGIDLTGDRLLLRSDGDSLTLVDAGAEGEGAAG